jgi:hypothetical protein
MTVADGPVPDVLGPGVGVVLRSIHLFPTSPLGVLAADEHLERVA